MKQKNRRAVSSISPADESTPPAAPFPWFLVGFLLMSLLGSWISGMGLPAADEGFRDAGTLTTWLLSAAMVGLGLNVNLRDLRTRALRPLAVMAIVSTLLSIAAFWLS